MEKIYEFKGGERLYGIYEDYHHIMMANELNGGVGGYKLSWAGTKESGPSFGGNQMDIAHNAYGMSIFIKIIQNAAHSNGSKILSGSEVCSIEKICSQKDKITGMDIEEVFPMALKIDKALASDYGKKLIHEAYVNEILSRGYIIEMFIDSLKDGPGKNFAKSDIGKMHLFDYGNQYGLKARGPLYKFLNGEKVVMKSGEVLGPITKQDFNLEDFKNDFFFHLKYYKNKPEDVIRRLNNIAGYVNKRGDVASNRRSENDGASIEQCAKLFNVSKKCIEYPTSVMRYGREMEEISGSIKSSKASYSGQSAYLICKELYGMDFESYARYYPKN
ncbi:MAG: hypothetical protein K0R73_281 [Candidatus Midichloriaceae bacterium]|jgi:hypothetical protein|nr:hypothetical protein [Candidatus Midichloriaceae bacterium]